MAEDTLKRKSRGPGIRPPNGKNGAGAERNFVPAAGCFYPAAPGCRGLMSRRGQCLWKNGRAADAVRALLHGQTKCSIICSGDGTIYYETVT